MLELKYPQVLMETILFPNAENESSGRWKYSINLTLSIIKIQTMG